MPGQTVTKPQRFGGIGYATEVGDGCPVSDHVGSVILLSEQFASSFVAPMPIQFQLLCRHKQ